MELKTEVSSLFGYLAGFLQIIGFWTYNRKMLIGVTKPVKTTLALWSFISILNMLSFTSISNDPAKDFISIVSGALCVLTFLLAWRSGKLQKLGGEERFVLLIGIIAALIWYAWKSAAYANAVLQVSVLISFLPLYKQIWQNPKSEHPTPWYFFSGAYACATLGVVLNWNSAWELAYPMSGLILHSAVLLMIFRKTP